MKKAVTKKTTPKVTVKKKTSKKTASRKSVSKRTGFLDTKMVLLSAIAVGLFAAVFFVNPVNDSKQSNQIRLIGDGSVYLASDITSVKNGETFVVKMYADSKEIDVNAMQGVIKYPADKLELKQVISNNSAYPIDAYKNTEELGRAEVVRGSTENLKNKNLVSEFEFIAKSSGAVDVVFDTNNTALVDTVTNSNILGKNSFSNLAIEVQ